MPVRLRMAQVAQPYEVGQPQYAQNAPQYVQPQPMMAQPQFASVYPQQQMPYGYGDYDPAHQAQYAQYGGTAIPAGYAPPMASAPHRRRTVRLNILSV